MYDVYYQNCLGKRHDDLMNGRVRLRNPKDQNISSLTSTVIIRIEFLFPHCLRQRLGTLDDRNIITFTQDARQFFWFRAL